MKRIDTLLHTLSENQKWMVFLFIPLLSLVMHFKIFNKDITGVHAWRQCQTQSNIDNFYQHDFNILNPTINDTRGGDGILRMEFPLMQWIFALFYKLFGNHIIISRILSFMIGLFSIWGFYFLIKELFHEKKYVFLAAWMLAFSPLMYYYIMNPLPDNFALCFCIWAMVFFMAFIKREKIIFLALSAFCYGISVATKLPFIVYIAGYFGYCLYLFYQNKFRFTKQIFQIIFAYSLFLLPAAIWYIHVIPTWKGNGIVQGVLENKSATSEIIHILKTHLISTLPELILNYGALLFFVLGFYFIYKHAIYKSPLFLFFLLISGAVSAYFFFEINMIGIDHDYYLFPFVPLIFIIAYLGMNNLLFSPKPFLKGLAVLCLLLLPFTAFLRSQSRWGDAKIGFNSDLKIYKNELRNAVPDTALCVVGNDISHHIAFYYIHKKGWAFHKDELSASELDTMIAHGAKYLYSDTRVIDKNPDISERLSPPILQKGSFRVFELKSKPIN